MELAVVIPGIMGTRLALKNAQGEPEEVWPPTPFETKFGYGRIAMLADPKAKPTTIIDKVLCFSFYGTLIEALKGFGYSEGGHDKRLLLFPYDWRRDLFETARTLADALDKAQAANASSISLVAHSMGGLISRILLETPEFRNRPWFGRIRQFVALAVPHLGAPLALARVLGLDSTLGVSGADFRSFAANTDYPSGYQLLPPRRELICWDQTSPSLKSLDIYDPADAKRLGLSAKQLARAQALHDALEKGAAPAAVRYFYFAGTGQRTVTRVNVSPEPDGAIDHEFSQLTRTQDGGDGTVPLYSALPSQGQRHLVVNEHSTVFEGEAFLRVFARLFGANLGPALEHMETMGLSPHGSQAHPVSVTAESPIIPVGREIGVTLAVAPSAFKGGTLAMEGVLRLERFTDEAMTKTAPVAELPVRYHGPALETLALLLPAQAEPGHYRLRFVGSPSAGREVLLAISAV